VATYSTRWQAGGEASLMREGVVQAMATRCDDTEGDGAASTTPKFSGSAVTMRSHGIPWLGCDRVAGPQTTARDTQAIARGLERQRYTAPTYNPHDDDITPNPKRRGIA